MPSITLPNGVKHFFDEPVNGLDIAARISPSLAKAALVMKVNGDLWDLSRHIDHDSTVVIITDRDEEGLEVIRHDTAHLMAEAVKELYPDTQVTIGPAIKDGFYYDFARSETFTPEDLIAIEDRMTENVSRNEEITREIWNRNEAIEFFKKAGEHYKSEIIASIPENEAVTMYRQGNFVDLCRGPHLPSTGRIGAFKLTKIAGAYWRGDSSNEMLQRIYGTAWPTKKDLSAYLQRLEEAEKRDHRRLGREMNLFHLQPEAIGMVFWHPNGWRLYRILQEYMRNRLSQAGYLEVKTPELIDRTLWEASGHWDKFREHMFTTEAEERVLALKPMNCPGHVQIFRQGIKSYRDLPLKISEFGSCHRYEPSGALHGLMRVRGFVQDDAHIFCQESQITAETKSFCDLLMSIYRDFGFEDVRVNFSDRPAIRAGSDEVWTRAENALMEAVDSTDLEINHNPGEGAFYGPKLEFVLTDAIGRDWQCGTLQVDFVLPERLDASYVGDDGNRHIPVMLHRAILGSMERFIGILIEHHAGRFPLWLAPRQVVVASITEDTNAYALKVSETLLKEQLRSETDLRNEKIGYKIREHSVGKIPVILAVGKREKENGTVAVRRLGQKTQEVLALNEVVNRLRIEAEGPIN